MISTDLLRGRRVLVTGGGFIGSRLAERLARDHGADVLVMVRRPDGAGRLRDVPCRVVVGDVLDRAAVEAAVAGCDTVFHCAFGTTGSQRHRRVVTERGTREVLRAGGAAAVRRIVHFSTYMVYGRRPALELTERQPRPGFGTGYADSKLAAEQTALEFAASGVAPAVVLQPTNVYGPHATVWVEQLLRKMRAGPVPLIDGGAGICNHVYVDDLADAAILAATTDGVVGETFLISSDEPVTWREYHAHLEAMIGGRRTVATTAAEARAEWRRVEQAQPRLHAELAAALRAGHIDRARLLRSREMRVARRGVGNLLPHRIQQHIGRRIRHMEAASIPEPVHALTPDEIDFFASRAVVCTDKARELLGFQPSVSLEAGMAMTADWARRSSLLP